MIVPNPDAYGTYAAASALADYLELLSLHGHSLTKATLGDVIADSGWRVRRQENIAAPETDEEEFDASEDRVYSLIRERRRVLGQQYPFVEDGAGRLTHLNGQVGQPYRALLAITLVHAYRVPAPRDPKHVLEQTVADVLAARGWLSLNFGALSRIGGFAAAVAASGGPLQLATDPAGAPHPSAAQDEGVDTLAHIPWCGARSGRWVVVGQVTCAVSNVWRRKILEPSPASWMRFLADIVPPVSFLAVPHHAEPQHRIYVMVQSGRLLLDRLSLVRHKAATTADEDSLIETVLAFGVERPT